MSISNLKPSQATQRKVLLVEDHKDLQKFLIDALSSLGYDFVVADDGLEAVECLKQNQFSIVLTDIKMPGMDGIHLLKHIKSHYPQSAVIAMTGFGGEYSYANLIQAGAIDYLEKPFTREELQARLNRVERELDNIQKIIIELSEREKIEANLRASEMRLRLALDATSDGVWDRDLLSGNTYYGENWYRILGYSSQDKAAQQIDWRSHMHPSDRPRALKAVRDHLNGRTSRYCAEFRMKTKAGSWKWIMARGKVVEWSDDGQPKRFIGTHTDISDRKLFEDELEKSSEKIKNFAYAVAHDIKNPAISLHGLCTRLRNKYGNELNDEGKAYCSLIVTIADQIAELADKINCYVQTRENRLHPEEIDLGDIINSTAEEFKAQFEQRQIKFVQPEQTIKFRADKLSIIRMLRNFFDNSLKYGGDKLTRISIKYQDSDDYHIVSFENNGKGLKPDEFKDIFRIFKRNKSSRFVEGSGLGLAIVKEIAELHKGRAWAEPALTKGINFNVALAKDL